MIVGLVGEAVVIAEDIRPLIPRLFLSPDNITSVRVNLTLGTRTTVYGRFTAKLWLSTRV